MDKVDELQQSENLSDTQKGYLKTATDAVSQLANAVTGIISSSTEQAKEATGDKKDSSHQRVDSTQTPAADQSEGGEISELKEDKPSDSQEKPTEEGVSAPSNFPDSQEQEQGLGGAVGKKNEEATNQPEPSGTEGKGTEEGIKGSEAEEKPKEESLGGQEQAGGQPSEFQVTGEAPEEQSKEPSTEPAGADATDLQQALGADEKSGTDEKTDIQETGPQGITDTDAKSKDQEPENKDAGIEEVKDAGLHETQPELLEASQEGQPSIGDARNKAEENAPSGGEQGDTAGQSAADVPEGSKDEEKPKDQPEGEKGTEGGAGTVAAPVGGIGSPEGQSAESRQDEQLGEKPDGQEETTPAGGEETTSKPEPAQSDQEPQGVPIEESPEQKTKEATDAGIHETEPNLLEASAEEQPSADDAREKAKENAPEVGGPTDQQGVADEPKTEQPASGDAPKPDEQAEGLGDKREDEKGIHDLPQAGEEAGGDAPKTEQESSSGIPKPDEQPEGEDSIDKTQPQGLQSETIPEPQDNQPGESDKQPTEEPPSESTTSGQADEPADSGASKPSMVEAVEPSTGESAPSTERELPERPKGESLEGAPDTTTPDTSAPQQADTGNQSGISDDSAKKDFGAPDDDAEESGKKVKLTEKIKNKLKEVTK